MPDSRPAGKYVVPYRLDRNGITGHWDWHVRVEEIDEQGNAMHGAPVVFGIAHESLVSTHGGSHQRFLSEFVKPEILKRHAALTASHDEALGLVGKPL